MSTLQDAVEKISDWVDSPNTDRGEALTWHRVCKPIEEIGEVAEVLDGDFDSTKLVAELLDVIFAALGSVVHLYRIRELPAPDLIDGLTKASQRRAKAMRLPHDGGLDENIKAVAFSYGFVTLGEMVVSLCAAGGALSSAMLGMSGQNPRKGVTASADDVEEKVYDVACVAAQTLVRLDEMYHDHEGALVPRLEALGSFLIKRAKL